MYMEALLRSRQGSNHRGKPIASFEYVQYTMKFTETLHVIPLPHMQHRSLIQFLPCDVTVVIVVRSAPPQAHKPILIVHLIKSLYALRVL